MRVDSARRAYLLYEFNRVMLWFLPIEFIILSGIVLWVAVTRDWTIALVLPLVAAAVVIHRLGHYRTYGKGKRYSIAEAERTLYRYYVTGANGVEQQVSVEEWRQAERQAGFHGEWGFNATMGFSGLYGISGRVEFIRHIPWWRRWSPSRATWVKGLAALAVLIVLIVLLAP